jgi:hypothetical protein
MNSSNTKWLSDSHLMIRRPILAPRKKKSDEPTALSHWPSPEEVRKTFNELRRSLGWPTKDENL